MSRHNVGGADRLIRLALGVTLLAFFVLSESSLRWLGLVGLVPLTTAALGWCPMYSIFGLSTCPMKRMS